MTKKTDDDFYDDYNLVDDEDIEKAKKKQSKDPIKLSSSKKKSNYEKVSTNKEIDKVEILEDEPIIEKQPEEFLVEYEFLEDTEEKKEEKKLEQEKNVHLPYIGFAPRLITCIVLVPIFSILAIYLLYHAYTIDDLANIRYEEQGLITSREINDETIKLDAEYKFKVNQKSNLSFNYQVVAELLIVDKENEDKIYFQESIPIQEEIVKEISEEDVENYRTNITINKEEYEDKIKKYQESYKVESTNYLNISLNVKYHSISRNSYKLSDGSSTSIHIPLLSQDKEIKVDNLDVEKRVNTRPKIRVKSVGLLGLGILVSIGAVLSLTWALLLIYSTMNQKSLYDKIVEKILKKYKKRIVEVEKVPRKTKKQIHTMNTIQDLIRLSKKLKQPVKYCVIHEHSKCQFFIEHEKNLYTYIIKEVDLEAKD